MHSARTTLFPVFALLLNALVWGLSWWPLRYLSGQRLHPLWVSAAIYIIATVLILAWRPATLKPVLSSPLLILIGIASGVTNGAFNWGVTIGEVVRVVLLFYLMPVWAVLLARLLLREAITALAVIRIGVALLGAILVLGNGEQGLPLPETAGDWLGVLGGMAFALNNVLLRKAVGLQAEQLSLAMILGGFLLPVLMFVSVTDLALLLPQFSTPSLLVMSAFGVAVIAGNFSLQYGASRLPVNITAVVMLAEIIIAALSAVVIGGEQLTLTTVLGGLCILSASLLSIIQVRHRP